MNSEAAAYCLLESEHVHCIPSLYYLPLPCPHLYIILPAYTTFPYIPSLMHGAKRNVNYLITINTQNKKNRFS
jgi:hypothetical protein